MLRLPVKLNASTFGAKHSTFLLKLFDAVDVISPYEIYILFDDFRLYTFLK